jgi:hypothetical protein
MSNQHLSCLHLNSFLFDCEGDQWFLISIRVKDLESDTLVENKEKKKKKSRSRVSHQSIHTCKQVTSELYEEH